MLCLKCGYDMGNRNACPICGYEIEDTKQKQLASSEEGLEVIPIVRKLKEKIEKKNILHIILITIILILTGCRENTSKPHETPAEIEMIEKAIDFWDGEYAYELKKDGEVWLTNVEGDESEPGAIKEIEYASIPEIVTYRKKEYLVTGIGKYTFSYCNNLQEVKLPDSIRGIDEYAFSNCEKLVSVNFPKNLEQIGEWAFSSLNIKEIDLGENLIVLKEGAFGYCHNLKSADLPANLENIEGWAFSTCEELEEVTIRGEKSEIEKKAFIRCESLKTFYVPKESLEYYQGVLSEYDAEVKTIEE